MECNLRCYGLGRQCCWASGCSILSPSCAKNYWYCFRVTVIFFGSNCSVHSQVGSFWRSNGDRHVGCRSFIGFHWNSLQCQYLGKWAKFLWKHERFRSYCRSSGMRTQQSVVQTSLDLLTPKRCLIRIEFVASGAYVKVVRWKAHGKATTVIR